MLKPFLFLSAVALVVIASPPAPTFAAGLPPQDATPASTNPVKPTAASQEKAKKLYAQDCAICHGDNGDGKTDLATSLQVTLADWTDPKSLASKSDQQLFDIVRKGKDKMPPEDAGRAKDAEVWGLITYIRAMSKNQPAAPAPAAPAPAVAAPPTAAPAAPAPGK
jgi:mono/diheme cytochrome c family protein